MANIFLSTNKATDFQQDYHEYLKQNAAIINQEEDECFSSQPMSLNSSPVATDVQTENCVHNPYKFSERSSYDLCSIYEIRILSAIINLRAVVLYHHSHYQKIVARCSNFPNNYVLFTCK
jgi:hypothetical protein